LDNLSSLVFVLTLFESSKNVNENARANQTKNLRLLSMILDRHFFLKNIVFMAKAQILST
jgi:hypothetical protein